MKKVLGLSIIGASLLFGMDPEVKKELDTLRDQVKNLQGIIEKTNLESMSEELGAIKKHTAGDNLKFSVDYRFAADSINYEFADGSEAENTDLLTNRLVLRAEYAPRDDLAFIADLSYHKAFGDTKNHQQSNSMPMFADFDWVTNETATDGDLKIKQAYFIYFGDIADKVAYTASVGRRPSTGGLPINLREDDPAQSPLAHGINVEFDGASFRFDLDKVTGVAGMYFKICLGRGLTNAKQRFSFSGDDYAMDTSTSLGEYSNDTDMWGLIFQPWSDGQYSVITSIYRAENLIGFDQEDLYRYNLAASGLDVAGDMSDPTTPFGQNMMAMQGMADPVMADVPSGMESYYAMANMPQFSDVGDYTGGAVTVYADGIGFMISDFLDSTKLFASWAFSKTDPSDGKSMLGSTDSKFGQSWWVGAQIPCLLTSDGKLGFEYNHGSKYWRSVTYGEDTMIGSKIAARGDAYEIYWTKPILGKTLTAQLRYTYIDYEYTGSNSFFGDDGTPYTMEEAQAMGMNPVETASDLRASIRYRY